jgi:RNA polymerase sigma factor (sigma-70 family)
VYLDVTTTMAIAESTDLAYERAFEEHWTDVFRFALAWTNDWTSAEDLAQEAYLRLWNHRGGVDWSRPVMPWLLVTTRRLATDRFRTLRRRLLAPTHPLARCLSRHAGPVVPRTNRARDDRHPGRDL